MKTPTTTALRSFEGRLLHGREAILAALPDLADARVGLLGDPVEVVRLVPRLAERSRALTVFQDEGVWVLPRLPLPGPDLTALVPRDVRRRVTTAVATTQLQRGVRDPWTRRQLTPRRPPTRQTTVRSNRYYAALGRDSVDLVTWPIAGVVPAGIRTADGLEHHLDVIARA